MTDNSKLATTNQQSTLATHVMAATSNTASLVSYPVCLRSGGVCLDFFLAYGNAYLGDTPLPYEKGTVCPEFEMYLGMYFHPEDRSKRFDALVQREPGTDVYRSLKAVYQTAREELKTLRAKNDQIRQTLEQFQEHRELQRLQQLRTQAEQLEASIGAQTIASLDAQIAPITERIAALKEASPLHDLREARKRVRQTGGQLKAARKGFRVQRNEGALRAALAEYGLENAMGSGLAKFLQNRHFRFYVMGETHVRGASQRTFVPYRTGILEAFRRRNQAFPLSTGWVVFVPSLEGQEHAPSAGKKRGLSLLIVNPSLEAVFIIPAALYKDAMMTSNTLRKSGVIERPFLELYPHPSHEQYRTARVGLQGHGVVPRPDDIVVAGAAATNN